MPIFMDRHDIPGLTAMDVAEGHKQDLKIQDRYGCRAITYWFDEKRGTAFCLIEAPRKEAVEKMHDEAHGLIPKNIIEVDSGLVEVFLGRITDPGTPVGSDDADLLLIKEPAFRTIMATQLKDAPLLKSIFGLKPLEIHHEMIQAAIAQHAGHHVSKSTDGFLVSFFSASRAVKCAMEIQKRFERYNHQTSDAKMHVTIGLSAGEPVTDRDDFFGEVIQFANRLCYIGRRGQVMVSSTVSREYGKEEVDRLTEKEAVRVVSPVEEQFLNRLMEVTEQVWNDETFNVEEFGRRVGLSKSQFYRKIMSLTGQAPSGFVKEFRLIKAMEFIEKQQGNISQIAFDTGFSNPSYFSKCFQKRFGLLPSEFARTIA